MSSVIEIGFPGRAVERAPKAPRSVGETGLSFAFLVELAAKILLRAGPQRMAELARQIALPLEVVDPVMEFLRRERMCEVASVSTALNPVFGLTSQGRSLAEDYLRISQYAGPAPVNLESYNRRILQQSIADLVIDQARVERVFDDVVITQPILETIGAAMNSGRAIFIYGPAGGGKTHLARHLVELLHGDVWVPHALVADGQVIRIFDPLVHVPAPEHRSAEPARQPALGVEPDARWVRCRRPAVVAGGELTLETLDLRFDESVRFYAAPPQVKANNGLLIIDDLGRQRVRASELMNRWIVPLEHRLEYLTLHTGSRFAIPFDVTVVFCSNLDLRRFHDPAFLRRLGYKIRLDALDERHYRLVWDQACAQYGVRCATPVLDYVISKFRCEGRPLLACTPRDLVGQVRDRARFSGQPPIATTELVDWAWRNYFAPEDTGPTSKPTGEPS